MPTAFESFFMHVVDVEKGLSLDPQDRGNWTSGQIGVGRLVGTKYGISAAAYPNLDIPNLTLADAKAIYHRDYWNLIRGDDLPPAIALMVGDAAVNQGVDVASRMLQTAIGVPADGIVGNITAGAASRHGNNPNPIVLEVAAYRAVRYAQGNMARNGLGWMRRLMATVSKALSL